MPLFNIRKVGFVWIYVAIHGLFTRTSICVSLDRTYRPARQQGGLTGWARAAVTKAAAWLSVLSFGSLASASAGGTSTYDHISVRRGDAKLRKPTA
jgi:hypothetical protein